MIVTTNLTVKLADLGEAIILSDVDKDKRLFPSNINWSSPETLNTDNSNINQAADVWSLGMVIFEIISGDVPFDTDKHRALTLEQFLAQLKDGLRPPIPKEINHISWLKELVSKHLFTSMSIISPCVLIVILVISYKTLGNTIHKIVPLLPVL